MLHCVSWYCTLLSSSLSSSICTASHFYNVYYFLFSRIKPNWETKSTTMNNFVVLPKKPRSVKLNVRLSICSPFASLVLFSPFYLCKCCIEPNVLVAVMLKWQIKCHWKVADRSSSHCNNCHELICQIWCFSSWDCLTHCFCDMAFMCAKRVVYFAGICVSCILRRRSSARTTRTWRTVCTNSERSWVVRKRRESE